MEHLYAKYHGCGHADISKWEFVSGVHRDSYASHLGHFSRLAYMSVAENESIAKTRFKLLDKMIQPCGPPPYREDEKQDEE
mmetsp:Transcript_43733/g.31884  ORF Transcript_43733/g.31884 Transcript_43733/m.31884 type:complete len:81 (+) Transcript_43733:13-255(+)